MGPEPRVPPTAISPVTLAPTHPGGHFFNTIPDRGLAETLFDILIASKTTGLGDELKAPADAAEWIDGAPSEPRYIPRTQPNGDSNGRLCTFEIVPRFDDPKSTYWSMLADVRVEVAQHTGKKTPYLIPSFGAPFVLRTPGWFKSHPVTSPANCSSQKSSAPPTCTRSYVGTCSP